MTADTDIERACAFLIEQVRKQHGARWRQGLRKPALTLDSRSPLGAVREQALPAPSVRLVLEYRLCSVCDDAARGVAAWQAGLPIALFSNVPAPRTLLDLQARG